MREESDRPHPSLVSGQSPALCHFQYVKSGEGLVRITSHEYDVIAEQETRQLIVVQGSGISASAYLFICACVTLRNAISTSFSARAYSHHLTISGCELLFISLDFMVQNDYGFRSCMMNILMMAILTRL